MIRKCAALRLCQLLVIAMSCVACAVPAPPPTSMAGNPVTTPTAATASVPSSLPLMTTTPLNTPNAGQPAVLQTPSAQPARALQQAILLADGEARAAQKSATLPDARRHAEALVNILIGPLGRWYGDTNGDGQVDDPSDKRGVLPAERQTVGAPDTPLSVPYFGWALLTYDDGNAQTRDAISQLLGDPEAWKSDPRKSYDAIAAGITPADAAHGYAVKLSGLVPQLVAYGRLLLTKTSSPSEAQTVAARAAQVSAAATQAVQNLGN
jgi:hypothetical protein